MQEGGYDFNKPRNFTFDLDLISSEKQARLIEKVVNEQGYKTRVEIYDDGDIFFDVIVRMKPDLEKILEIERLIEKIACQHGARYIGFGI